MISNLPFIIGEGTEVLELLFSTFGFSTSKAVDHRGSLSRDGINTKSYENKNQVSDYRLLGASSFMNDINIG
jgi:hypothetical protein